MGNVNNSLIETALDTSADSLSSLQQQQQPSNSLSFSVCNEIRRVAAEPSQRELYRLLREEIKKGSTYPEKLERMEKSLPAVDRTFQRSDSGGGSTGTDVDRDSVGASSPPVVQSKASMAPKKKFLFGYRGGDDKPEDKPVSDQQQPVAPPVELYKVDKAQESKQQQQQPVTLPAASTDNKESVRSRSNTVSFPVRSRALPPVARRAVPETSVACSPSTVVANIAVRSNGQPVNARAGNANSFAAAGNDAMKKNGTFGKQLALECSLAASGLRKNPIQDTRNYSAVIRAQTPASTAYYPTLQQQQQQQQYISRQAEAKTQQQQQQQQQQQHISQFADRPPRQAQQMERPMEGQQMSPYYQLNSNIPPHGYTSSDGNSKMSHGEYNSRAAGRPGMEFSRQMQPSQQQQQHAAAGQRWTTDRYGQGTSVNQAQNVGQRIDVYQGRMEQAMDVGVSAAKYRAVNANYSGNITGSEVPYDRQRMQIDAKYLPGGYKPRVETVRQQVHEQFESMFPPSQASSRYVQRSPHGSSMVPVDQRMAGFQPLEPVEPTIQQRNPGLMPASPATSDRSGQDSERYASEQMYQQRSSASVMKIDSESQKHRMMWNLTAGKEAPALFVSTPETSMTRSSRSSGSRPDRAGPESPLDLTTRRDEPLTAEAFLRRCHEPAQERDRHVAADGYSDRPQYMNVERSDIGQYRSEPVELETRGTPGSRYSDYRMEQHAIPGTPQVQMHGTYVRGHPPADWQTTRRTPASADARFPARTSQIPADYKTTLTRSDARYAPVDDQKMAMWSKRNPLTISDTQRTLDTSSSEQYSASQILPGRPSSSSGARMQPVVDARLPGLSPRDIPRVQQASSQGLFDQNQLRMASSWIPQDGVRSQQAFIRDCQQQQQQQSFRATEVDTQSRYVRNIDVDAAQTESVRVGGRSPSLPQLSPVPQAAGITTAATRRIPIVQLLGSHSPSDILHLRCNVCASTYGSLRSFRMHFAKVHGLEPSPEHFTIQTISDARSLMTQSGQIRDSLDDSRSVEDSPPSLQKESFISFASEVNRKPAVEFFPKQVAEVYPIPKKSSPFKPEVESNPPTPIKKSSPVPVKRSGEERNMKCMKCGHFSTQDWGVFRRHIRTHSECVSGGSETPPDPVDQDVDTGCAVCMEGFSDVADWKMHVASQHMMRSCACKSCDLGFTNASALRRHLMATHGVESAVGADVEVEYRCLFCPEVFAEERKLYAHTHAHEHRYTAQRNLRYIRPGSHSFEQLHRVQTAIPDTTCPEEQRSSTDVLTTSKSDIASPIQVQDSADPKQLISDGKTSSAAVTPSGSTTGAGNPGMKPATIDPTLALVKPVAAEAVLKLGSRKASILRRMPTEEDEQMLMQDNRPQQEASVQPPLDSRVSTNGNAQRQLGKPSMLNVNSRAGRTEDAGEPALKKPLFGDLLRSMQREVETSLRGFLTDTPRSATLTASPSVGAGSKSASSSPPSHRDICDAIITQSLRKQSTNAAISGGNLLTGARQLSPLACGAISPRWPESRIPLTARSSPRSTSEAGSIGRDRRSVDSNGNEQYSGSPRHQLPVRSPRSAGGADVIPNAADRAESIVVKSFTKDWVDKSAHSNDSVISFGSESTGNAVKLSSESDVSKNVGSASRESNVCLLAEVERSTTDDADMFEQPLFIDLNHHGDDDDDILDGTDVAKCIPHSLKGCNGTNRTSTEVASDR